MNYAKSSPTAILGGQEVTLTNGDIGLGFWHTADLFDNKHIGPAVLTLESGTYFVTEAEWHDLYYLTDPIVQRLLTAPEHEGHTLH